MVKYTHFLLLSFQSTMLFMDTYSPYSLHIFGHFGPFYLRIAFRRSPFLPSMCATLFPSFLATQFYVTGPISIAQQFCSHPCDLIPLAEDS